MAKSIRYVASRTAKATRYVLYPDDVAEMPTNIGYAIGISLQRLQTKSKKKFLLFVSFLPPPNNHGLHRATMEQITSISTKTDRQTQAKTAFFLDDFFGLRFPTKGSADVKFLARFIAHFRGRGTKFSS